jgi:hypothetical protein
MKFIQLCGPGRVGKSTISDIIHLAASSHGFIPVCIPFAKALKQEAADKGFGKEVDPEGYRHYCQKWGAGRRKQDEDYWIKKVRAEVEECKQAELELKRAGAEKFEHLIIQDDVRYINELAYGLEVDAYQLYITPGDRDLPEMDEAWRLHESERTATTVECGNKDYCQMFDEFIVNDLDMDRLVDLVYDRFATWVTADEHSPDIITETYRAGLNPNPDFEPILEILELVDGVKEMMEEIEDEETNDSDS